MEGEGFRDWARLVPGSYAQLRAIAHEVCRGRTNVVQATEVLHEVLIDLQLDLQSLKFEGEGQFFALASQRIRWRLIDLLRRSQAEKRGGLAVRIPIDPGASEPPARRGPTFDFEALHVALEQLQGLNEVLWRLTELKFFCGLRNREVGELLGLAEKTVEAKWAMARAWLQQQLGENA